MKNYSYKDILLEKWAVGFLIFGMFVFAFIRSAYLDITNDEAYSIMLVDSLNRNLMIGTANTHWLNSFFIFFENLIFGHAEWSVRLHSSIAIGFFTYYLIKIFKTDFSFRLIWIPIIILVFNNYLIDFFSQCRGYGIAVTFEMISFYYIIHKAKEKKFLIYLLLSLATLSNFTCIYILYSYLLLDIIEVVRMKEWKSMFTWQFMKPRIPLIAVTAFALPIIYYIKYVTGDLEEGLQNGFFQDTLGTFFQMSFDQVSMTIAKAISLLMLLSMIGFYIFQYAKISSGHKRMFELIFVNVLLIHFLFFVLHVPFPYGRTSFFFVVPFLLMFSYVLLYFINKLSSLFQILIPLLFFIFNTIYIIKYRDFRVTKEWWMQQGLSQHFSEFRKMNLSNVKKLKFGMSIDHYGSFDNYYRYFDKVSYPDSIFVYGRQHYDKLDSNIQNQFAKQDYLLMINDYKLFLNQRIPVQNQIFIKRYQDMKTDFLRVNH